MSETEKPKGIIEDMITPGFGANTVSFIRKCIIACMFFLAIMSIFFYNIHYVIMEVFAIGLFFSFDYLVNQIKELEKEEKAKKEGEPNKDEEKKEGEKPKEE